MTTKRLPAMPGPYTVGPVITLGRFGGPSIKDKSNGTLAIVISGTGRADSQADLFAASADLLAACERWLLYYDDCVRSPTIGDEPGIEEMRAAVAKAKGTDRA